MARNMLVVARFAEDLAWLDEVPSDYDIIVYNKGVPLKLALHRPATVIQRPEGGRESETYLFHIETIEDAAEGYTVFTQGNPFDHSPDFIRLLGSTARWRAIQPLTCKTDPKYDIPPKEIIEAHRGEHIDGATIRSEMFSVHTIAPLHFYAWTGYHLANWYRVHYELPVATNLSENFLRRIGMDDLAEEARTHLVGRFVYGAIFGIRADVLTTAKAAWPLAQMRQEALSEIAAYFFEIHWLHLYGVPFLLPATHLMY